MTCASSIPYLDSPRWLGSLNRSLNNPSHSSFAVCIAGAHRSGTSMLTRLLHACGLELGADADLMPARPDNPDGFWENLRFVSLNDDLLSQLGGAWDLPPCLPEDFSAEEFTNLRVRASALIEEFRASESWGWKDPRSCLTLPFWKQAIGEMKTVIIVRNPLAVAHSLRMRNGTSYAFGLRLWEIYNRRVLEATAAEERLLTHYDSFFEEPESALERVADFCGLALDNVKEVARLVALDRRHTHFTLQQMADARVSPEVIAFYEELFVEASEGHRLQLPRAVDGSVSAHPTSASEYNNPLSGTVSRLEVSLPEKLSAQRDAALDRAKRERETYEAQLAESTSAIAGLQMERETLRARFLQINQLLRSKSTSLGQAETHNSELRELLRRQVQAMKKLITFLSQLEVAARRLRDSRRWKLANLFGWLRATLRRQASPGFGHIDKIVGKFNQWRLHYPEMGTPERLLHNLVPRTEAIPIRGEEALFASSSYLLRPPPSNVVLEFPTPTEVVVSVIIPVFNNFDFTQSCLASVQACGDDPPFEVIVVDDGSSDETVSRLEAVSGLRLVRGAGNAGFIASCNLGAEEARGDYLLFLNNDTLVTPGWLNSLYDTFQYETEAGLVGSKLVYPDGRLQEAGGIIWQDASGWNRGKYQDADKPEYNYLREVDYCSAASVMIRKSLFESLGGFDPKYAPAYYEDTDLAFKVRAAGGRVLYQPLSKVIHYEGATGGTDLSSGTKQYQDRNRTNFAKTWEAALAGKPSNGDIAAWSAPKMGQKRILVIDHHLPMPDRDSGSLRMSQILVILHRLGHHVSFLPDNLADIPPYGDNLRQRGIEVLHYPYIKSVREYLQLSGLNFDVIILSRCDFAQKHIANVRHCAPRAHLVFDTVDLHFLREEREAELTQLPELAQKATERRQAEYALIDEADETWVVSPLERDLLAKERPNKSIQVLSNIVDVPGSATPYSLRRDILFIGGFQHPPNTDAVLFFTREILPLVQQRLSDLAFYIIGDKAPPEVIALGSERVIVTGYQPDVSNYFNNIRLSVAPLRYGAGVKGKVNQSMAYGVPIVATSIAVEGMDLVNRHEAMIADTPEEFAKALIEIYESAELWERVSHAALQKACLTFSGAAAKKQLAHLLSDEHIASLHDLPILGLAADHSAPAAV